MSTAIRNLRNWKSGAWGAAVAVIFGVFQPLAPWLANLSYDLSFRMRPDGKHLEVKTEDAYIIYMNDQSHDDLSQDRHAIWNRSLHAQLIRHLIPYHPKAVAFDVLFDLSTTNDTALVEAVRMATNAHIPIIVGAMIIKSQLTQSKKDDFKVPFDDLGDVASWGWSEIGPQGQILRRHYPAADDHRGNPVPSMAYRTAALVSTNALALPDPAGDRWINYYGPQGVIPSAGYSDVLSNNIPLTNFTDKVCFVGAYPPDLPPPAGGLQVDTWPTPYGKTPGVDINATVYLNLIRGDWLKRLSLVTEDAVILASGLLFGWGLTLFRPMIAAALGSGGMLLVTGLSVALMTTQNIWFSWLLVAGVQIPVSIGWSVLVNTKRLATEKAALQTQLVAAQTAMQELATGEGMATRVEGGSWSERADTAAEKALAVIAGTAPDGQTVVPDHDLVRRVGKGAYGEVWLARNIIGTYHAVKIVKREDFESDEPFEREFRGIQKFMPISRSHPGLVQILHAGRNQQLGYMYYIMEVGDDEKNGQEIHPDTYVPKNLAKEIKKHRHLPAAECLQLGLQLTSALEYLHQQNLIHRDIKPANIIFVKGAPKFADIGLVTEIAQTTRDATFLGTVGYISPEGPGTPAADVFSLGKVLYEATMGLGVQQYPELPSTMIDRPDLQAYFQLNQIILKACQEDRNQRYQTAAEMHTDLLKLQTTLETSASSEK